MANKYYVKTITKFVVNEAQNKRQVQPTDRQSTYIKNKNIFLFLKKHNILKEMRMHPKICKMNNLAQLKYYFKRINRKDLIHLFEKRLISSTPSRTGPSSGPITPSVEESVNIGEGNTDAGEGNIDAGEGNTNTGEGNTDAGEGNTDLGEGQENNEAPMDDL